ncbi:MAG: S1C family serine protease [Hyphomicrobiales bacterium]
MTEPSDAHSRSRRAIDGLDWDRANPEGEPRPAARESEQGTPSPAPRDPAGGSRLPLIAAVAGVAAIVGGLVGGVVVAVVDGGDNDGSEAGGDAPQTTHITVEQTSAIAEVAAKARPSVIRLQSTRRTPTGIEQDVGSGVVLDDEGHVLTNAHVVLGTESLKAVLPDGSERPAILLGHDYPFTDLAVVQVGPGSFPPVAIGDSSQLAVGETVVAIGNPLSEFDGSVSVGVVSGLNRKRVFDGVLQPDLIQTDAAVNSGNSGGALLNLRGEFVGMPTAVLRDAGNGPSVEGIAFALPSNRVMEIARTIIATGSSYPRPTMGIAHIDLDPASGNASRLAVDRGALVTDVASGSAAAAAGIVPGDIVTRIGDQDVNPDNPFLNAMAHYRPGETVRVVLNRGGRIIEAEVHLGQRS